MGSFGALFLSLPILLRWPNELGCVQNQLSGTDNIAALWRRDQFHHAELKTLGLLADQPNDFNCLILLALCAESLDRFAQLRSLIQYLSAEFRDQEMTRWLKLRHWINKLDSNAIALAGDSIWSGEEDSPLLSVLRCRFLLASQDLEALQLKLDSLDPVLHSCLEIQQCKGDLAVLYGNDYQALEIWKSLIEKCPSSRPVLKRVLQLGINCRDSEVVLRASRLALDQFGEHPDFLSSITAIKLHQRQPGLGQRSSLLSMVWRSLGLAEVDISNQFSCYEMNGLVDWLEYVLPSAIRSPLEQQTIFSNRTMQLASISSNQYKNHVQLRFSASIECDECFV